MNIFDIIKENLPDGLEISDKQIKAIEKEINTQQGLAFVPKEQYRKKVEKISELEESLKELSGNTAEMELYKEKFSKLEGEYKNYKETTETELKNIKNSVEAEKIKDKKKAILKKQLESDGANPNLIDLIESKFNLDDIELDGDKIKGWEDKVKPIKETYKDVFGRTVTVGAGINNPPNPNSGTLNPWDIKTLDLEMQTKIFRENPTLANSLAESVGIKL